MRFRLFAAAAVLALTTVSAHAQAALYFNPVAIHVSNSKADSGPFAFLGQNSKSQMFYGVNIGGYYNFFQQGKTEVGIDVRDSLTHGNSAMLNSFLVGVRISTSPFERPLKPYVVIGGGAGTTRAATTPKRVTRGQYGIFAGADYTLAKHIDYRIVEVGYSSLSTVSSDTVGGSSSISASSLLSFSTGVVFRF
jgi:hypothetical protein